jgi:hypothetical protein
MQNFGFKESINEFDQMTARHIACHGRPLRGVNVEERETRICNEKPLQLVRTKQSLAPVSQGVSVVSGRIDNAPEVARNLR